MSKEAGGSVSQGPPVATRPEAIRNVLVVGAAGGGKTTLVERLLVEAGVLNRAGSTEDGTTVCDFDEIEHRQRRSVALALAPLVHDGVKVNLLDAPGYVDFVGEVRAGLRAADCALFAIAANEGVDEPTRALWRECADVAMPRVVVITKLDHARADVDGVVAQARSAFGDRVLPVHLHEGGRLVGLLTDDHGHAEQRAALVEGIIEESEDETLMERYLGGEQVDPDLLVRDLELAVARGSLHPVVPVDAMSGVGARELLDLIVSAFPSPLEHRTPPVYTPAGGPGPEIECDPSGPLVAEVVKTTTDPYLGRVSLVRVFSGTLLPDASVHVSGHRSAWAPDDDTASSHPDHDEVERIGTLSVPLGNTHRPAPAVIAGDICAIGRLRRAETSDTLAPVDTPLVLQPWQMPDPSLPVAIQVLTRSDEDKLGPGLQRLAAEDPTLRVEHHPETHQVVLWTMGEAHADVLLDRLAHRYGVAVEEVELLVPLRETFARPATGHGRHVKQSGGHGQYAVCSIEVEPLPQGSGFEFVDRVVGGAVPRQFIPSVEKGVRSQMSRGVDTGHPMVDLRVTLTDGKAHSVDSSDMAFQTAGGLALRDAATRGGTCLLEPVDEVEVLVDDSLVGTVMGDLSARRGRVLGSEPADRPGMVVVRAHVPQLELRRYSVELRSLTHGSASFTRAFAHYERAPDGIA
ncbi:elongation factor G-like protein EF-G2 [Nocardioides ganghwensis]|uniref:Elongation factor G-like protein n=1 Tax=Nocardioides ganghwensis TaxID=252230 RepID=A0A4Q2SGY5_9ACTN|nr:elongation factor G-like protein EF-G2 [Nocardioides ganghwensis]MBD3946437.1 elongation factor G-like protein EF-G2 [Nocardioides ganghwensis]RYC03189.1 elongation factor G-like protein EF-G2 [Nocardioides ganghwensis]